MVRVGTKDEFLELDQLELPERDFLAFRPWPSPFISQAELDVSERGSPGEQLREILEHDAAVHAIAADCLAADQDLPAGRCQGSGDDVELASTCRTRSAPPGKGTPSF